MQEEDEGMQHFIDYMRKQGLVIMDTSKAQNPQHVFNKMDRAAERINQGK